MGIIFDDFRGENYTKTRFCVIFSDFFKENYTSAVEMRKNNAGHPENAKKKGHAKTKPEQNKASRTKSCGPP